MLVHRRSDGFNRRKRADESKIGVRRCARIAIRCEGEEVRKREPASGPDEALAGWLAASERGAVLRAVSTSAMAPKTEVNDLSLLMAQAAAPVPSGSL